MTTNGKPETIDEIDYRSPISIISDKVEVPPVKLGGRNSVRDSSRSETTDQDDQNSRTVHINLPQSVKYCGNKISTAKYNLFTFAPIFLFEQFRKYSNIFFLFIALLQQIPDVSPTGRFTTLTPLVFILSVSAVKEIVEDYKRHRADRETNHRKVEVLRTNTLELVKWKDIVVGDVVKVKNNNFFPADVILLSSSEPQGICFIETSNLDGETNLKIRQGLTITKDYIEQADIRRARGDLLCENPNRLLYDFKGVIQLQDSPPMPLGPDQLLLRGAQLRNTLWIYGIVIYTGHETKLMKNSTRVPLKRSRVDKMTNIQILMLFFMLLILCLVATTCNVLWTRFHIQTDWYIGLSDSHNQNFGFSLLTFIILFNNLIPISLQVSIEVVRIIQATFINMDLDMYHEESDTPAMARTSNLNEELGMVKYIFSDKTGTLTRNIMEFKKCSIAGVVYDCEDQTLTQNYKAKKGNHEYIGEFMELLSVCHTVIPEKSESGIVYQAASPDERALVNGAKDFGWTFVARTPDYVEVVVLGQTKRYQILNVIEFTSRRKRMSVIIRDPNGLIKIFCKGADTVIYERLDPKREEYCNITLRHLEDFAKEGLRTLCCAFAVIPPAKYNEWNALFQKATTSIKHRDSNIEEVANLIEVNLIILGATAIEDKLQDQVPETIETLIKADIKVWVLTGDKQETAINIGYSCRLITTGMPVFILNEDSLDATREVILRHIADLGDSIRQTNEVALVIDGNTLKYALCCDVRREFLELCTSCKVVICCRVSPSQKADVVELISKMTKAVTLAIGDGANDVAMIQKANVGVGISGVEGLQAACASDYSIAQFKYLVKLLLVHGAWNYDRICKLILYSFYKNICLYVIELWFAIYSGWSGQILFEKWSIGLYNVVFTAGPPLAMGLFDRVCSAQSRMAYPELYYPSQNGKYFNFRVFWIWILNALYHSVILFWLPLFTLSHELQWPTGLATGYLTLGNAVYTYVVVTVCLKAGLTTSAWTWVSHLAIWGSICLWFCFLICYSAVWPFIPIGAVMVGEDYILFTSPLFWVGLFLIPGVALLLDFVFLTLIKTFKRSFTEQARIREKRRGSSVKVVPTESVSSTGLSETARLLRTVKYALTRRGPTVTELELSHGFAFSQEEGGVFSQSQMIRAYNTTIPKPTGM